MNLKSAVVSLVICLILWLISWGIYFYIVNPWGEPDATIAAILTSYGLTVYEFGQSFIIATFFGLFFILMPLLSITLDID